MTGWPARRRATVGRARGALLLAIVVALGASLAPAVQAQEPDPILEFLQAAAALEGQQVMIDGDVVTVSDPAGDQQGFADPAADILEAVVVDLPTVPPWVRDGLFGCEMPMVDCSDLGAAEPEVFDGGAWLVMVELAGPLSGLLPGRRYEWGVLFALERFPTTPVQPGTLIGGFSHLIVTRVEGEMRGVLEFGIGDGSFQSFRTRTRTRSQAEYYGMLVPKERDLPTAPTGWNIYAFSSDQTQQGTGRDVVGNIGDPPIPIGTPPVVTFQDAAPSPTAIVTPPPATAGPTAGPTPTQGGTGAPPGAGIDPVWLAVLAVGLLVALLGGWFLLRGRSGADPCPPLIEAARRARAACEEALRAAADAAEAARARSAEAEEAQAELERARRAREEAERELERRREEPDRSSWMESGGRHEDSYDLKLKADARAAANAAHADAVRNAGSDAERRQAHEDWQQQLEHIDAQEGLDELREQDVQGRARWVEQAQAALDAATEAEAAAQEAANRASEAARAADAEAAAAKARADEACARADAAERAAIDAGCMSPTGGQALPPPAPAPEPEPPESPAAPPPPPPTGGTLPPPPPTPPGGGQEVPSAPRQCEDGEEEWRPESAPVGAFLVPIPGEKIQVSASPSFSALEEYLTGWQSFDADSRQTDGRTAGVPPSAFRRADDARWRQLFADVGRKAMHVEIAVTLPLQLVRVHCERLYQCRNGAWVRTDRCRAVEHDPAPQPKTMKFEKDGATLNEIVTFGRGCVAEWTKAEAAKLELDAFHLRCCR